MNLVRSRSNHFFPTVSRVFDDFFNDEVINTKRNLPAVNIKENDKNYELELAVPGLEKSDINLEVKDNILSISSKKEESKETVEKGRYTRREFSFRSFKRLFTLPKSVDKDNIKADYRDGVLNVEIPKGKADDDVKKIEIGG